MTITLTFDQFKTATSLMAGPCLFATDANGNVQSGVMFLESFGIVQFVLSDTPIVADFQAVISESAQVQAIA